MLDVVVEWAGRLLAAHADLGMPRLSCCFCIFSPRSALLLAGKHNPGLRRGREWPRSGRGGRDRVAPDIVDGRSASRQCLPAAA